MHSKMLALANIMAFLGGVVLSLLIVMTCISIVGRMFGSPIQGDYELVEAGVAFAIFAFLPLCQITAGHASVDIFTNALSARTNRILRVVIDILFAAVMILIAWRLGAGMISKMGYGETSFEFQFPIWWAYAASLMGASLAALMAVYVAVVRVFEVLSGRIIMVDGMEAEH